MRKLLVGLPLLLFGFLVTQPNLVISSAQNTSGKPERFAHAVVRSEDSAKIVSLLNDLNITNFPKTLVDKAEAIAVFPKVDHEKVLFVQSYHGYGVICARGENGWSLPAFYQLGGTGFTGDVLAENEIAVLLLFMNKQTLSWFDKGRVALETPKNISAGPLGELTEEQKKEIESAKVLAYVYDNSRLLGMKFGKKFKMQLNPDNNINNPVYGIKGREVLAGKAIDASKVPTGIAAFQAALAKYHNR